jgi:hypothetical protein
LSVPYLLAFEDGHLVMVPHPSVVAAWPGDWRDMGTVDGPYVHAAWQPKAGDALDLISGDERWRIVRTEGELVVTRNGAVEATVPMSGGDVDIIADGPVLEICTGRAVYAAAIAPVTTITSSRGAATFRARRPAAGLH